MSAWNPFANLSIWAGLWLAPIIWAANMQLGQILPYVDCNRRLHMTAVASFLGAAMATFSGLVSWRCGRRLAGDVASHPNTSVFSGRVSALSAAIFTFALLMQGIASMVLSGCER